MTYHCITGQNCRSEFWESWMAVPIWMSMVTGNATIYFTCLYSNVRFMIHWQLLFKKILLLKFLHNFHSRSPYRTQRFFLVRLKPALYLGYAAYVSHSLPRLIGLSSYLPKSQPLPIKPTRLWIGLYMAQSILSLFKVRTK